MLPAGTPTSGSEEKGREESPVPSARLARSAPLTLGQLPLTYRPGLSPGARTGLSLEAAPSGEPAHLSTCSHRSPHKAVFLPRVKSAETMGPGLYNAREGRSGTVGRTCHCQAHRSP